MAQEDQGLVMRGLVLFSALGVVVAIVLVVLFWRPSVQPTVAERPSEQDIVAAIAPTVGAFPSGLAWANWHRLSETLPSAPGWDIRYNAATTLARRGSSKVPWHLLREMLDAKHQLRNNRVPQHDGTDIYDEASARATTLSALRALAAWHDKRRELNKLDVPPELPRLYAVVDELTQSPYVELKVQAEKCREAIQAHQKSKR